MKLIGFIGNKLQPRKGTVKNTLNRVRGSRSKVKSKVTPKKAHLLSMTFIPAKYEIDSMHSKETTGRKRKRDVCNMLVRVTGSRSKVKFKVTSQKAHLLDMTLIPAKFEIDWLHSRRTTGQISSEKERQGQRVKVKGQIQGHTQKGTST